MLQVRKQVVLLSCRIEIFGCVVSLTIKSVSHGVQQYKDKGSPFASSGKRALVSRTFIGGLPYAIRPHYLKSSGVFLFANVLWRGLSQQHLYQNSLVPTRSNLLTPSLRTYLNFPCPHISAIVNAERKKLFYFFL